MGKFSGFLICSDFDGTVASEGNFIDANVEALEYFKANGGTFTIISGRTLNFLGKNLTPYISAGPAAAFNGTLIYDFLEERMVKETFTDNAVVEPFAQYIREAPPIPYLFVVLAQDGSHELMSTDEGFFEKAEALVREKKIYKLFMRREIPYSPEECERIIELFGEKYECVRSSPFGMEIQGIHMNKGIAARFLAQLLGAHTLICIGDFENDISMIKEADIGYAVKNAIPSVKAVADRITVGCRQGALAAVIADIEDSLKSQTSIGK